MNSIYRTGIRKIAVGVLAVLAFMLPLSMQAGDIFAELASFPEVQSTYISGRFAHNRKTWRSTSGLHAIDLSRGFSSLYTYQCYSEKSVKKAESILKDYLSKNPNVEMVMRTLQSGSEYVVYEKFGTDGKLYQMLIWTKDDPQVCEIVVIDWKDGIKSGSSERYGENTTSYLPPTDINQLLQFKCCPLL
ncbi:MAG: hypothetical protein K2M87_07475 [Muribaculaceae bacterium]|nr:hypothetical protein [Muribaculaceae bacterium]